MQERRTGDKKVTMREVAAAAGVSYQTVSRVLNDQPYVAEETRRRVLDAIQRLEYRPDAIARSLIKGRSYTLGVITGELEHYGPHRLLTGIDHAAASLGYSLALSIVHHAEPDDGLQQLENLLSRQVDGVIWAVPEIETNLAGIHAKLGTLNFPVILVAGGVVSGLPAVLNDNLSGGRLAAAHLLEQGYKQIGHISGPQTWTVARERQRGWQEALTAANRAPESRQIVEGDWSAESGEHALHQLIAQYPEIDALFASNDQMALGVLQAAHMLGRRVPEDLAVVGFDATPESAYYWPPLTTVRQHLLAAGSAAVHELHRMIEEKRTGEPSEAVQSVVISPELVVRQSSRSVERAASDKQPVRPVRPARRRPTPSR